jgi:hypothetical protein
MPKDAFEAEWEAAPAGSPVFPVPVRLVPAALFCGVVALMAAVAVWSGLAVGAGACVVSDVLRKLSQAKVAQAAISTQRYLKGLRPDLCRATLKLTAIDYTG